MPNIILLRSQAQDAPDAYQESFKSLGYRVSSVPVLDTASTNMNPLKRILLSTQNYGGVIVSSARASQTWTTVVKDILLDGSATEVAVDWSSLPFYVVGKATATALRSIRDVCGDSRLVPKDIRGSSESGTSERLAHFILDDLTGTEVGSRTKLLYLTGDKNKDTLPSILKDGGFDLECLQVYETHGSPNFAGELENVVKESTPGFDTWWIVFFAPSSAEFAIPTLRGVFDLPISVLPSDVVRPLLPARVAAIGPTTSAFLRDGLNLDVNVVPAKPTPEDLVSAIINYDRQH